MPKAVFSNLTIEGGIAQDDGTSGALPGTTAALGGGILVQGTGQASLEGVTLQGNLALGGNGATVNGPQGRLGELVNRQPVAASILRDPSSICRSPRSLGNVASGGAGGNGGTGTGIVPSGLPGQADGGEREQAVDSMPFLGASSCQHPQCPGTARPEEQVGAVGLR